MLIENVNNGIKTILNENTNNQSLDVFSLDFSSDWEETDTLNESMNEASRDKYLDLQNKKAAQGQNELNAANSKLKQLIYKDGSKAVDSDEYWELSKSQDQAKDKRDFARSNASGSGVQNSDTYGGNKVSKYNVHTHFKAGDINAYAGQDGRLTQKQADSLNRAYQKDSRAGKDEYNQRFGSKRPSNSALHDKINARSKTENESLNESSVGEWERFYYKANEQTYVFYCRSRKTSRGFAHDCELQQAGKVLVNTKICYLNRTWEMFEYQSVMLKAVDKAPISKEDKTILKSKINKSKIDEEERDKYGLTDESLNEEEMVAYVPEDNHEDESLDEGIYDDTVSVKFAPRLADMCKKVAAFKEEAWKSNYDPKYRPQAEAMLNSFVARTEAVADNMSEEEKDMARKAYGTLTSLIRRWDASEKLGSSLSNEFDKILAAGRKQESFTEQKQDNKRKPFTVTFFHDGDTNTGIIIASDEKEVKDKFEKYCPSCKIDRVLKGRLGFDYPIICAGFESEMGWE